MVWEDGGGDPASYPILRGGFDCTALVYGRAAGWNLWAKPQFTGDGDSLGSAVGMQFQIDIAQVRANG